MSWAGGTAGWTHARIAWLLALLLGAGAAQAGGVIAAIDGWLEPAQAATIEQVASLPPSAFRPVADEVHALDEGRTLWLRLRLQRRPQQDTAWRLVIPVALLNEVALYEPVGAGWRVQHAGDRLAVAQWARPGRHPSFDVQLPSTGPRTVYLRVRHDDPIGFAIQAGPAAAMERSAMRQHLGVGVALGALLVLAAWCVMQVAIHRDAVHAWYAAYGLLLVLTVGAVTGLAGELLWDESPGWADVAQAVLPVLLAGVHLLFMAHLCALWARHPRTTRAAVTLGWALVVVAGLYPWLGPALQRYVVAGSLLGSELLGAALAVLAWRRGDRVGPLVLLAYAPLGLALIAVVLRLFGVLPAGWLNLDSAAVAAALAVPLLLLAMNERSRYRLGVLDRLQHSSNQDALTGVLSASAFGDRLHRAVTGAFMRGDAAAVVLVDVANLRHIRDFHGDAVAEQSLLHTVIQLSRVVRPSDPVGRIDTGRFAVILEGARSRREVQETMVRLVAAGLAPVRGDVQTTPLRLRIACAMLHEKVYAPSLLLLALGRLVEGISPRSRRPVRFLESAGEAAQPTEDRRVA